jgi:alpha-beta hydrolase superfamily lysophospholipase
VSKSEVVDVRIPLPDGEFLTGHLVAADRETDFAVVWVHGFGSHRGGEKSASLQAACVQHGFAFAAFDFRGHGASSGTMHSLTASRLLEDLEAIRQLLKQRGYTRLGLVGSSMGGFASAWLARRHPELVVGCVLLAPAFELLERRWDRLTPAEREEWKRTDRLRVRNDWVDVEIGYGLVAEREQFLWRNLAREYRMPTLIFHGMADDVVPFADSVAFVEHAVETRIELRLLKDGDHRLTAHKDEIAAEACRFLERCRGS